MFPPRPYGTAPLYPADELQKLQTIMDRRSAPPPPRGRNPWLLRGLVLVAVAVVSGLVWWLVNSGGGGTSGAPTTSSAPAGKFAFVKAAEIPQPLHDTNCAAHSYGKTKEFLGQTPCQQLTRALYTTKLSDGRTVYSSVSVVRMKSAEDAAKLKDITSQDGTGSVSDLLLDKAVSIPGLDRLNNGGFANEQRERTVVIVESDSPNKGSDKASHHAEMKRVSLDALRLAADLT
ncbi:hypothetical protein Lesp02_33850 [Lentzea sp. NBRC 105346]|nr:hypothetical protein Lesp02_33850 [Lentzea sp. NBRC 105346]